MFKVAIPYFTGNGHTQKLAENIAIGAESVDQVSSKLINVVEMGDAEWEELHQSDAIIFGSPTYLGSAAASFKSFLEETSRFWVKQRWQNKLAGAFTIGSCPSGDKLSTLMGLINFAMEHGMIWVGQDHVGSRFTGDDENINHDGSWLGLMATSNPDKSALIFQRDEVTAQRFGKRIAEATLRWGKTSHD